jgi:glycosyltransferase involved in cell wall biosynthesis
VLKQSIAILAGGHLCHNPRVIKEAAALQDAGYQVEVFGGWVDPQLKVRDQELMANLKFKFRPLHDLTEQPALRLGLRMRGRLAGILHKSTGCENRWQLGYAVSALRKAAGRSQAALLIAHSEPALWAVAQLQKQKAESRKQNFRLGVDMEDWFSEDLPPQARSRRPVKLLHRLERELLCHSAHTSCTSRAMSRGLASEYGCRPPTVIYNAFPWADRQSCDGQTKDRQDLKLPSLHWYSQTLGTDRGLGDLFDALPFVRHEAEIHLRGKPGPGFENWLRSRLPSEWQNRVFIHELVSNEELLSRIAEHDIGFAGEMKHSRSRDLTVTNKILHYLLAGLAVVASDTAGQREVAEQAKGAVRVYPSGNPQALAVELNALLASRQELQSAKAAALAAAEQSFCWERIAPKLLRQIETGLAAEAGSKNDP